MAEPTLFPQFPRLPAELQLMVWEEFARAEAASRIVPVHSSVEVDRPNTPRWRLHIMPLKRLVSPLLCVSAQSRRVALAHYDTPVSLYELYSPMPPRNTLENRNADEPERTAWPPRYSAPHAPAWAPEQYWVDHLEYLVCCLAGLAINTGGEAALARRRQMAPQGYPDRGCVRLALESDRFLFYDGWREDPLLRPHAYGLRALADAMLDYKYHRIPFDPAAILARRPPVLRNASAELLPEMLGRIRHVVFDAPDSAGRGGGGAVAGGGGAGGGGGGGGPSNASTSTRSNPWLARMLPRAFSPEGSIGGYQTTREMGRCFYDDIEDKGPAHLGIATAKLVRGPGDAEGERGWLDWATDDEHDSDEEDSDEDGDSEFDYYDEDDTVFG